jgi:hypothetical protein
MVDAPDDNTWMAFLHYVRLQAEQMIPEAAHTAERRVIEKIRKGDLDFRWRDADGHEHTGWPHDFLGMYVRYNSLCNAIESPFPQARALYRPEVRERRHNTNAKPKPVPEPDPKPEQPMLASPSPEPTAESVGPVDQAATVIDEPQWPWRKDPSLVAREGTKRRKIQLACDKHLKPSILLKQETSSPGAICRLLGTHHVNAKSHSVRRAFGYK